MNSRSGDGPCDLRLLGRRIVDDLARGLVDEVFAEHGDKTFSASTFRALIDELGLELTRPDPTSFQLLDAYSAVDDPDLWIIECPLWTVQEGGESDYVLKMRVVRNGERIATAIVDFYAP